MDSATKITRLPGLLWLSSALTGGFAYSYLRGVVVSGDAAATAGNIMASEFLFRAAILGNLLSQTLLLFFALKLYGIFREADRALARAFLASAVLTVAVAVVNAFNPFGALWVLSKADYLKAFTAEQLDAAAMVFLRLNGFGQALLEIFWVPYYFSFGLLVVGYRFLPKVLGVLLMLMGVGFAVNIVEKFLFPQFYPAAFTLLAQTFGGLGGIPNILWLLIKGIQVRTPDEGARA